MEKSLFTLKTSDVIRDSQKLNQPDSQTQGSQQALNRHEGKHYPPINAGDKHFVSLKSEEFPKYANNENNFTGGELANQGRFQNYDSTKTKKWSSRDKLRPESSSNRQNDPKTRMRDIEQIKLNEYAECSNEHDYGAKQLNEGYNETQNHNYGRNGGENLCSGIKTSTESQDIKLVIETPRRLNPAQGPQQSLLHNQKGLKRGVECQKIFEVKSQKIQSYADEVRRVMELGDRLFQELDLDCTGVISHAEFGLIDRKLLQLLGGDIGESETDGDHCYALAGLPQGFNGPITRRTFRKIIFGRFCQFNDFGPYRPMSTSPRLVNPVQMSFGVVDHVCESSRSQIVSENQEKVQNKNSIKTHKKGYKTPKNYENRPNHDHLSSSESSAAQNDIGIECFFVESEIPEIGQNPKKIHSNQDKALKDIDQEPPSSENELERSNIFLEGWIAVPEIKPHLSPSNESEATIGHHEGDKTRHETTATEFEEPSFINLHDKSQEIQARLLKEASAPGVYLDRRGQEEAHSPQNMNKNALHIARNRLESNYVRFDRKEDSRDRRRRSELERLRIAVDGHNTGRFVEESQDMQRGETEVGQSSQQENFILINRPHGSGAYFSLAGTQSPSQESTNRIGLLKEYREVEVRSRRRSIASAEELQDMNKQSYREAKVVHSEANESKRSLKNDEKVPKKSKKAKKPPLQINLNRPNQRAKGSIRSPINDQIVHLELSGRSQTASPLLTKRVEMIPSSDTSMNCIPISTPDQEYGASAVKNDDMVLPPGQESKKITNFRLKNDSSVLINPVLEIDASLDIFFTKTSEKTYIVARGDGNDVQPRFAGVEDETQLNDYYDNYEKDERAEPRGDHHGTDGDEFNPVFGQMWSENGRNTSRGKNASQGVSGHPEHNFNQNLNKTYAKRPENYLRSNKTPQKSQKAHKSQQEERESEDPTISRVELARLNLTNSEMDLTNMTVTLDESSNQKQKNHLSSPLIAQNLRNHLNDPEPPSPIERTSKLQKTSPAHHPVSERGNRDQKTHTKNLKLTEYPDKDSASPKRQKDHTRQRGSPGDQGEQSLRSRCTTEEIISRINCFSFNTSLTHQNHENEATEDTAALMNKFQTFRPSTRRDTAREMELGPVIQLIPNEIRFREESTPCEDKEVKKDSSEFQGTEESPRKGRYNRMEVYIAEKCSVSPNLSHIGPEQPSPSRASILGGTGSKTDRDDARASRRMAMNPMEVDNLSRDEFVQKTLKNSKIEEFDENGQNCDFEDENGERDDADRIGTDSDNLSTYSLPPEAARLLRELHNQQEESYENFQSELYNPGKNQLDGNKEYKNSKDSLPESLSDAESSVMAILGKKLAQDLQLGIKKEIHNMGDQEREVHAPVDSKKQQICLDGSSSENSLKGTGALESQYEDRQSDETGREGGNSHRSAKDARRCLSLSPLDENLREAVSRVNSAKMLIRRSSLDPTKIGAHHLRSGMFSKPPKASNIPKYPSNKRMKNKGSGKDFRDQASRDTSNGDNIDKENRNGPFEGLRCPRESKNSPNLKEVKNTKKQAVNHPQTSPEHQSEGSESSGLPNVSGAKNSLDFRTLIKNCRVSQFEPENSSGMEYENRRESYTHQNAYQTVESGHYREKTKNLERHHFIKNSISERSQRSEKDIKQVIVQAKPLRNISSSNLGLKDDLKGNHGRTTIKKGESENEEVLSCNELEQWKEVEQSGTNNQRVERSQKNVYSENSQNSDFREENNQMMDVRVYEPSQMEASTPHRLVNQPWNRFNEKYDVIENHLISGPKSQPQTARDEQRHPKGRYMGLESDTNLLNFDFVQKTEKSEKNGILRGEEIGEHNRRLSDAMMIRSRLDKTSFDTRIVNFYTNNEKVQENPFEQNNQNSANSGLSVEQRSYQGAPKTTQMVQTGVKIKGSVTNGSKTLKRQRYIYNNTIYHAKEEKTQIKPQTQPQTYLSPRKPQKIQQIVKNEKIDLNRRASHARGVPGFDSSFRPKNTQIRRVSPQNEQNRQNQHFKQIHKKEPQNTSKRLQKNTKTQWRSKDGPRDYRTNKIIKETNGDILGRDFDSFGKTNQLQRRIVKKGSPSVSVVPTGIRKHTPTKQGQGKRPKQVIMHEKRKTRKTPPPGYKKDIKIANKIQAPALRRDHQGEQPLANYKPKNGVKGRDFNLDLKLMKKSSIYDIKPRITSTEEIQLHGAPIDPSEEMGGRESLEKTENRMIWFTTKDGDFEGYRSPPGPDSARRRPSLAEKRVEIDSRPQKKSEIGYIVGHRLTRFGRSRHVSTIKNTKSCHQKGRRQTTTPQTDHYIDLRQRRKSDTETQKQRYNGLKKTTERQKTCIRASKGPMNYPNYSKNSRIVGKSQERTLVVGFDRRRNSRPPRRAGTRERARDCETTQLRVLVDDSSQYKASREAGDSRETRRSRTHSRARRAPQIITGYRDTQGGETLSRGERSTAKKRYLSPQMGQQVYSRQVRRAPRQFEVYDRAR